VNAAYEGSAIGGEVGKDDSAQAEKQKEESPMFILLTG
jgi:hypothetical protein